MADSEERETDYARGAGMPANALAPRRHFWRRFRRHLLPTLAVLVLVPSFISFGQWQWRKAGAKESLQTLLDARNAEPPVSMPDSVVEPESMRFRRVVARGTYEPRYQILIDNRIHREQAGYHVVTPLRLEGSDRRVLVNRGWVPALADHAHQPAVATPTGLIEIQGTAVAPSTRYFTLGAETPHDDSAGWQTVWQNLDLARYAGAVAFPVQPVIIQLAPESSAGGFIRDWPRPDERIERHLGYAFQWWGFAAATVLIWLAILLRRQPGNPR